MGRDALSVCNKCGDELVVGTNWTLRKTPLFTCLPCQRAYDRARNDKKREQNRQWRASNKDKVRAYNKKAHQKTPKERLRRYSREYWQRLKLRDPARYYATFGYQDAVKRGWQRPPTISKAAVIEETLPVYAEALRLTRETGIKHEVDHELAISAGGVHRLWNLQVLTWKENRDKRKQDTKARRNLDSLRHSQS
jgi:5-methylcytosine-specific restriction endonuclease McrA